MPSISARCQSAGLRSVRIVERRPGRYVELAGIEPAFQSVTISNRLPPCQPRFRVCHTFVLEFVIPAFPARYACLAIKYVWRAYWYVFPSTPRIYRKFLWLWKCWVRNERRTIFQYLNSFFQEVVLIFQFFDSIQKFFLFHVYPFCLSGIASQPACQPRVSFYAYSDTQPDLCITRERQDCIYP